MRTPAGTIAAERRGTKHMEAPYRPLVPPTGLRRS